MEYTPIIFTVNNKDGSDNCLNKLNEIINTKQNNDILIVEKKRGKIVIPELDGYITLKCDFHMHTVFSDGRVWPTVRIDEAYKEGLDAIAITDHIEYRPEVSDSEISHNSSFEAALEYSKEKGIILIRGAEISRSMPPGHHNAVFLKDADELNKNDYINVFYAAKTQGAFIFWNHPGWEVQQPFVTEWWHEHTFLLEQGMMHGIEVVNANSGGYYPEAHKWCLEKKLTMLGNSDIHGPVQIFEKGKHRTMTLVFARSATPEAILEALMERRTAVYYEDFIIGEEIYLNELFIKAVNIGIEKSGKITYITFRNTSDLVFYLKKDTHDERIAYLRDYTLYPYIIKANNVQTILVRMSEDISEGDVNFIVENFLVEPGKGMKIKVKI